MMSPDQSTLQPNAGVSVPSDQLSSITTVSDIRSPMLVYKRRKLSLPAVSSPQTMIRENTSLSAISVSFVYKRRKKLSQPDSASLECLAGTRPREDAFLSGLSPNATSFQLVYKRRKGHLAPASSAESLAGTSKAEIPSLSAAPSPNAVSLAYVYKRRWKLSQPEPAADSSSDSFAATRQRGHTSLSGLSPNALSIRLVYKRRKMGILVYKRRRRRNLSQRDSAAGTRTKGSALLSGLCPNSLSQTPKDPKGCAVHSECTTRSVNESCSSSRSDVDFTSASMNKEVDDTGECSSSARPPPETIGKDASVRDICISILVRHGVIKRVLPCGSHTPGRRIGGHGCRLCNVCSRSDSTERMLICDDCEEAFHLSCCRPQIKAIPLDEWLCRWCLGKNRKVFEENSKCHNISDGAGGSLKAASASGTSPIELMLMDTKPYATGVRVGKGFQAEVPDWSGPAV